MNKQIARANYSPINLISVIFSNNVFFSLYLSYIWHVYRVFFSFFFFFFFIRKSHELRDNIKI